MKTIKQHIIESLKINSKSKVVKHKYYHPVDKIELALSIAELFKQEIYDLNCIDTSKITDMRCLFSTNVLGIFSGTQYIELTNDFEKIDISNWDVSNVKDFSFMFANSKFNGDTSKWKINLKANISHAFDNCPKHSF